MNTYPEKIWRQNLRVLPNSWLSLEMRERVGMVALCYVIGGAGLWVLFPLTHNGATMFLPLACASWLFRYPGLLFSILLNGLVFQLTYLLQWQGILPSQALLEGGVIGLGTSLGLGLIICWLRDASQITQQRFTIERMHLLAQLKEQQAAFMTLQQRQLTLMKDQFLMHVSHELRTPLTVLTGYLDVLQTANEQLDSDTRSHMLQEVRQSSDTLLALVEQALSATALEELHPGAICSDFPLRPLLQEVLTQETDEHLNAYTVHLQANEQVMVRADPALVRQILRHLLSNIHKYVPRQTTITVQVTQTDPASPVCLRVQDEGPGIPTEEQSLLFEKCIRLKRDRVGSIPGMGLGLYLCKHLVLVMGGRIWIESAGRPGKGSCFCLTLPTSARQTGAC